MLAKGTSIFEYLVALLNHQNSVGDIFVAYLFYQYVDMYIIIELWLHIFTLASLQVMFQTIEFQII